MKEQLPRCHRPHQQQLLLRYGPSFMNVTRVALESDEECSRSSQTFFVVPLWCSYSFSFYLGGTISSSAASVELSTCAVDSG